MAHDSDQPSFDDDDHTHFNWDFPADEAHTGRGPASSPQERARQHQTAKPVVVGQHRSASKTVENGPGPVVDAETVRMRAAHIRRMLDAALDRWWRDGALPSLRQLRDGLELLAAGADLPEPHRTLLLRTALTHGRGVITALHYQTDPERVGLVMCEMLLDGLDPDLLAQLPPDAMDGTDSRWRTTLARELRLVLATGDAEQRLRARHAFEILYADELGERLAGTEPETVRLHSFWIRRALLLALAVSLAGFLLWQRFEWLPPADMASVPAGLYLLQRQDRNVIVRVSTDGFFVDRFEVSNAAYRRCVDRGRCTWPASNDSATHKDYFILPAFDSYPVVNVNEGQAAAYCAWRHKRLPTEIEWQIAAGSAPNTPPTPYPWGMTYDPQRANGAAAGFGDTLMVGFYRPAGDSLLGVSDMAGNVAEWTATSAANAPNARVVKGGSYRSEAAELAIASHGVVDGDTSSPWLGFRCVRGPQTGQ